ncbi:MAG: hypothetical protein V3V96_05190 [Acidiferrobacterales bacterium]
MLHFVIALQAEAKPLIDHFGLRRRTGDAFPIYDNQDIALIVSGIGKVAAAAATGYLQAQTGNHSCTAWLNIGIAGHSRRAIGDGVLAHKITDQITGRSWYPPLTFGLPCASDDLITVDEPETEYRENGLYDMEAAGFYATACRFTTAELVHCYKIVSDSLATPTEEVSGKTVQALIERRLDTVDVLVQALRALAARLAEFRSDPGELARFLERWRFTVSEQHQLRRLLLHWQVRSPKTVWSAKLAALPSANDALRYLRQELDILPIEFSKS